MMRIRTQRRGFTMLELAVAIALSSVVVVMLYSMFSMETKLLRNQDLKMEMHQNSRFGMEILSRSIRMAGFGSQGTIVGEFGNGSSANAKDVLVSYDAFGTNGSDAITVAYMEPSLVMNTSYSTIESCTTSTITFDPNHLDYFNKLMQFQAGDLLMCYDYAALGANDTYLWSITADATTSSPFGTISVDSSVATSSDFSAACPATENISPVIRCSKGQVATFYIDDTNNAIGPGSPGHPVLMMDLNGNFPNNDDVPLIDNVEDIQFQYCIDDGTNTTNCSSPLNWTHTIPSGSIANVWMVRISMVVRSPRERHGGIYPDRNVRPALANNSASTTADGYYREVVTTEVTVRNLRLF